MILFLEHLWSVGLELSPWLLLGAAVSGLIHVMLPKDFVRNHLTGRGSITKAVVLGIPLPLCSCGVIPAGLGLKKDGASDGASVGFLISTPQTGVDSILVSAAFLGWPFAIFKLVAAAITGMTGGILTDRLGGPSKDFAGDSSHSTDAETTKLKAGLIHADDLIRSIWGWIVMGVVVSAAISTFIPADSITTFATFGAVTTMLTMLVISVPLYVCATASVPIAASLVASGMPTGAALVFLMAGPATNVATIGTIHRAFGRRVLAIYLTTIVVGSVGLGLLYDSWLGAQVSTASTHGDHDGIWAMAATVFLSMLMLKYAINDGWRWLKTRRALQASPSESRVVLSVQGMTCGGCVSRLERELNSAPGVTSATVTLEPGQAIVDGELDSAQVSALIEAAGFSASA